MHSRLFRLATSSLGLIPREPVKLFETPKINTGAIRVRAATNGVLHFFVTQNIARPLKKKRRHITRVEHSSVCSSTAFYHNEKGCPYTVERHACTLHSERNSLTKYLLPSFQASSLSSARQAATGSLHIRRCFGRGLWSNEPRTNKKTTRMDFSLKRG